LVDRIKAEKPQAFDANTIRIFLGGVRAYCTLNDLDKAGAVSTVLVELGPDTLSINDVLIEFAKLLNLERKKADARVTELDNSANADELAAAKKRLESVQNLLGKTLVKLSQRKELGLGHMMFIGETLNTVGMTDQASEQFQKILKRTETDPEFAKRAKKAMSLLRTELLKVLRKQEKYGEALKQVDQLIQENPNALEPLMEKGRILEAWAEKDSTKFSDAVTHWAMLRNRLQGLRKKPNEYYEVMYNVANCLIREAEKSTDKAKKVDGAKKAEQVLKSPMILTPKLNGPDTVARYKVLLNKAVTLQGRSPQKVEKKP
jgi:tetratricopeptide (TPR) repeat protein